ncbi:probable WRKY transcription factor 53 isoform X2 [Solanum tuberosum]|uniref:WRKY transcription factor-30 n=1 Tax=Solanum tuberosum TaxID=4113 RepID=M1A560_SOLTU|nr:PREDICTED: probable WRKY transcription factor 53 isoform X2 [Solanum tuberosum]KAH0644420.1 hypothetical protein KY284_032304 [Solanum tuberosum]
MDYDSLINKLTQGMEHTKQLRTYLSSVASTSKAIPELLLQKILSSYEQSLLILKWSGSPVQSVPAAPAIESMVSGDVKPRSDDNKRSSEDHQKLIHISKRRKPYFSEQVRVKSESEVEGPQDDGYSWRKYGQKDILGAVFPRDCYRCTSRHMQRSDVDRTVFEITNKGYHTCLRHQVTNSTLQATSPEKEASHHGVIVGGCSSSFVSPTTPESNYLSISNCQMNGLGIAHNLDHSESYPSDIGLFRDLHHSDSDRTDISANTSTTSSSMGGEFARLSGGRPDFSIWTKRHPQTKANTPQKDDKDE